MKRRTLLMGSIWSGFLAMMAPVRAAFAPNSQSQKPEITPYDALEIVYDEFEVVDSAPEIGFDVTKYVSNPADFEGHVRCKLIADTHLRNKYENIWLVLYESILVFPEHGFVKKSRELKVLNVISEEAYRATSSEEYDEKRLVQTFWSSGGSLVAMAREHHHEGSVSYNMEMGNLFSVEKSNRKNPRIMAVSRFLSLLTR